MDLFVYNGTGMVNVLDNLEMMHEVAAPNTSYKETAEIDGKLTDFVYTLIKYDKLSGKETIQNKKHYTSNADTMSFCAELIMTSQAVKLCRMNIRLPGRNL